MNKTILLTLSSIICFGTHAMQEEITAGLINSKDIKSEYNNLLSAVVVSAHHAQLPRKEGLAGIVAETLIEYPFEIAITDGTVMAKLNQARTTTSAEFAEQKLNGATDRFALWKGYQKAYLQQIPVMFFYESFDKDIQHNENTDDEENQKMLKSNTNIPVIKEYIQGTSAMFLLRAITIAVGDDKK